jgi:hypothetical protein
VVTITTPTSAFAVGDGLVLVDTSVDDDPDVLEAVITEILPGGFRIAAASEVTITGGLLYKSDYESLLSGFVDVVGDGSPIVRIRKLRNRLVVYRAAGGIDLAQFTGDAQDPLVVETAYVGTNGLSYKWLLSSIGDDYHLFRSKSRWHVFDLVNRRPIEDEPLELCSNLFEAIAKHHENEVFTAEDIEEKETWICTREGCVVYDWDSRLVHTVDVRLNAAGSVAALANETEYWFASQPYGEIGDLVVHEYDPVTGEKIWLRDGEPYTAEIASGWANPAGDINEVVLTRHLLTLSSVGEATGEVRVVIEARESLAGREQVKANKVHADPGRRCLLAVHAIATYVRDRVQIFVSGNTPPSISSRTWTYRGLKSRGTTRR